MMHATTNGNGPPADLSPGELYLRLQEMPRPSRIVDFPRLGPDGEPIGKVAVWIVTQEEHMICAAAAERFAKDKVKDGKREDLGYETVYANSVVVELLYRACRQAEDLARPAFPSPQFIRQKMTADECGRLFEYYLSVQLELGPILADLKPADYEAWIDRIAAGGLAASPFILLSPEMQKALVHYMASRLRDSPTGKSSAGSQPDEMQPGEPGDSEPADVLSDVEE